VCIHQSLQFLFRMLPCIAVWCSVLQYLGGGEDVRIHQSLQYVAVCCRVLQCVAVCCSKLHHLGDGEDVCMHHRCRMLQYAAVYCSVLQCVAVLPKW